MGFVDRVFGDVGLAMVERKAGKVDRNGRLGPGEVIVVVVPHHEGEAAAFEGSQRSDVCIFPDAAMDNGIEGG